MPYVGQKPADIISTAVDTVTGKFSGEVDAASLDISGNIDVDGVTNLDVVDIDGAVDMATTLAVAGVVTANAGVVVDNITIDGTQIDLSSGDLTLDVAGDIILDADGGDITIKDGGTSIGAITNTSSDLSIYSTTSGHSGIRFHENGILPTNNAGALIDNDAVLGDASYRYTNLFLSGGVYLGGTGTANKLDDYEEGTFTPTLGLNNDALATTGGTGRYTKIGRHVYVEGTVVRNTADGTGGAILRLTNIPFTALSANSISIMGSGTMWIDEGGPAAGAGDTVAHAFVNANTTIVDIVRGTSSGAETSSRYAIGSEMNNGRPLYFNFVYTTA